jgi:hypothetical protein
LPFFGGGPAAGLFGGVCVARGAGAAGGGGAHVRAPTTLHISG